MLTINIPTYNRVKHIKLLLASLFQELDENPWLSGQIFIKVFNNSSSDETGTYLNSIFRSNLSVYNRENNIGASMNIFDSTHHCETEYLWIIGDDDIPSRGLLSWIVNFLNNNKPELLYLRAVWLPDIFKSPIPSVSNKINARKLSAEQFVKHVGAKLTFISSVIFSFDYYSACKKNDNISYKDATEFPHIIFYSPAIIFGKSLFVVDEAVINATGNSNFNTSTLKTFGVDLPNVIRTIFGINNKLVDRIIVNLLVAFLPSFVYSVKFVSFKSLDREIPWLDLQQSLGQYRTFWIFVYPLKFLPKLFALPLVALGRLFR